MVAPSCATSLAARSIEPHHQRVVKRRRNGQGRERIGQQVAAILLAQPLGFEHHAHQLFNEQWNALCFRHDLTDQIGWQRLPTSQGLEHAFDAVPR